MVVLNKRVNRSRANMSTETDETTSSESNKTEVDQIEREREKVSKQATKQIFKSWSIPSFVTSKWDDSARKVCQALDRTPKRLLICAFFSRHQT